MQMTRYPIPTSHNGDNKVKNQGTLMHIARLLTTTAITSFALAASGVAFAQTDVTSENSEVNNSSSIPTEAECLAEPTLADCPEQPASTTPQTGGQTGIVITGSRIARPNLDSSVPVTSVSAADLTDTGDVNIGDNLNDLPSLRSTYSQGNSTRFIGTSGLNLLDLRGLGISRTLVLVNGRRHVTALTGEYIVDVNTIPIDLLERTDIVTGGNSAIYGSDAIAGVVNFILRRDFERHPHARRRRASPATATARPTWRRSRPARTSPTGAATSRFRPSTSVRTRSISINAII